MSVKVMAQVWELDLPQPLKLLALALADWAHDDGTGIYASKGYMAWRVGAHPKTIQRQLRLLEKVGIVVHTGWKKLESGYYTRTLEIHPERGSKLSPLERDGGALRLPRGSAVDPEGERSYVPQSVRDPLDRTAPDFEKVELEPRLEDESWSDYLRRLQG